jgi:hypothetical protein
MSLNYLLERWKLSYVFIHSCILTPVAIRVECARMTLLQCTHGDHCARERITPMLVPDALGNLDSGILRVYLAWEK